MNRSRSFLPIVLSLSLSLFGCGAGSVDDEEPDPVSVNIGEASASVEAGATFQFHVTVYNSTNQACAWSVNSVAGGNATVGTISSAGLYTAPAAVPNPAQVTVKAVAEADTTKSDTATVTITAPPLFVVSPDAPTVSAGGTQQFTTTPAADVTWSLEGAEGNTAPLGEISTEGLFTAPLSPPLTQIVTVVATSKADTSVKSTAQARIRFSDASLQGHYAFAFRATDAGEMMFVGGCFVADGHGAITDGIMDMNSQARGNGFADSTPFTGTYQVVGDGRTYVTLTTATEAFQLRLALADDSHACLMVFEAGRTGAGELERQDDSSFAGGLTGSFVFAYDGLGHVLGTTAPSGQPIAAACRFTSPFEGTLTDVAGDININGAWQAGGMGSGAPHGTIAPWGVVPGMGLISLGGTSGATRLRYYMLSADAAFLVSVDWHDAFPKFGVIGRILRQASGPFSKASLDGELVNLGRGYGAIPVPTPDPYTPPWPAYSGGIIKADGAGTFSAGTMDKNVNGTVGLDSSVTGGGYDMAANGRGSLTVVAGGSSTAAFTVLSNNTARLVGVDPGGTGSSLFLPQAGGRPFSAATLNGHYALALTGTLASVGTDVTGQILLNGIGDVAGVGDVNAAGALTMNASFSGTYAMSASGRGTMTITGASKTWTMTMYLVDPGKVLLMGTSAPFSGTLTRQF